MEFEGGSSHLIHKYRFIINLKLIGPNTSPEYQKFLRIMSEILSDLIIGIEISWLQQQKMFMTSICMPFVNILRMTWYMLLKSTITFPKLVKCVCFYKRLWWKVLWIFWTNFFNLMQFSHAGRVLKQWVKGSYSPSHTQISFHFKL